MCRLALCLSVAALLGAAGCEKAQVKSPTTPAKVDQPKPVTPAKVDQPKPVAPAKVDQPKPVAPAKVDQPKPVAPAKVEQPKPPTPAAGAKALTLEATKDARIFFHPSEVDQNGGTSSRLRTSGIGKSSGEVVVMDFDRAALKAFLARNKAASAKLVLTVREVQGGPGKVEAAALDTASDWNEGAHMQEKAGKGEVTNLAAQTDAKPWTTAAGKEVKDLRELVYDAKAGKIKTLENANAATLSASDTNKTVSMELDGKFLEHLATDPNCKGLVLFTRDANAKLDVFSREQHGKGPKLEVTAN